MTDVETGADLAGPRNMDVRPGGGVGEAQPPQRPEQTRGCVLRPPQELQVPELLPFAVLLSKADPRAAEVPEQIGLEVS